MLSANPIPEHLYGGQLGMLVRLELLEEQGQQARDDLAVCAEHPTNSESELALLYDAP